MLVVLSSCLGFLASAVHSSACNIQEEFVPSHQQVLHLAACCAIIHSLDVHFLHTEQDCETLAISASDIINMSRFLKCNCHKGNRPWICQGTKPNDLRAWTASICPDQAVPQMIIHSKSPSASPHLSFTISDLYTSRVASSSHLCTVYCIVWNKQNRSG